MDYTLKTLSRTLIGQTRHELPASEVPGKYDNLAGLKGLLMHGESDAWLTLGIMFQLSGIQGVMAVDFCTFA